MSTAQRSSDLENKADWKITSKALDLLQCFMSGMDDIIIQIALRDAIDRTGGQGEIRIEASDIERAANRVMEQIRTQGGWEGVLKSEIDVMDECLKAKCRELL